MSDERGFCHIILPGMFECIIGSCPLLFSRLQIVPQHPNLLIITSRAWPLEKINDVNGFNSIKNMHALNLLRMAAE